MAEYGSYHRPDRADRRSSAADPAESGRPAAGCWPGPGAPWSSTTGRAPMPRSGSPRRSRPRGGRALPLGADIADPHQVDAMVGRAVEEFGGLDFLVANAGIWTGGAVEALTDADWARMIGVNLTGTFHLVRAAVPHLRAREGAGMVFIASTAGQRGEAFHSHYAASKGGLIAFTRSLAVELAPIRVNVVAPGWIRTDMSGGFAPAREHRRIAQGADSAGRPGRPRGRRRTGGVSPLAPRAPHHRSGAERQRRIGSALSRPGRDPASPSLVRTALARGAADRVEVSDWPRPATAGSRREPAEHAQAARHRGVADQGPNAQAVPGRGLHRQLQRRPHPRPAGQRRRDPRRLQEGSLGPPGGERGRTTSPRSTSCTATRRSGSPS